VGGVTITNATLHNQDQVNRLRLRVGCDVEVQRAGDVIPEIIGSIGVIDSETYSLPAECPECGTPTVKDGKWFFCPNSTSCKPQLANSLRHFCSPDAMAIEGIGEFTAEQLVEKGIADLASLYSLKVSDLSWLGNVRAGKLVTEISASKSGRPLYKFIFGLGIRGVGITTAKKLAPLWSSLLKMENSLEAWSRLASVDGIGDVVADSIVKWISNENNQRLLESLEASGVKFEDETPPPDGPLSGQTICITGKLSRNRNQIAETLSKAGAVVVDSVTKKVTILLAGEDAGSKIKKAESLGIRIISEDSLYREYGLD
jgi:DNA ligase (NAD+)